MIAAREEVISAYPSEGRWTPHTTRSWEFLTGYEGIKERGFGFEESDRLPPKANHGKDVIVGMLDSGANASISQLLVNYMTHATWKRKTSIYIYILLSLIL